MGDLADRFIRGCQSVATAIALKIIATGAKSDGAPAGA
jgi:hypothetical protein